MNKPNQATRSGNYLVDCYEGYIEDRERQEIEQSRIVVEVEGEN